MKITALMENTACCDSLAQEHGLSLYVETMGKVILFDAGPSPSFAENAEAMGVDLNRVDFAVLSHGHWDHSGGLMTFLEKNDHAKIYMTKDAFGDYYDDLGEYVGVDQELKKSDRIIYTDEDVTIQPGMTICPGKNYEPVYPINSADLTVKVDGELLPEAFDHEQYLVVEEEGKRIVISGCSHRGIMNIMAWFKPDVMIGGFHFMDMDATGEGEPLIQQNVAVLKSYEDVQYYTCHCTGLPQYDYLKERMGDQVKYLSAGMVIEI